MLAHQIMNSFFVTVRPTDSVQQAVEAMTRERVGIVCVCDDSQVPVGVVTDRDIVTRGCSKKLSLEQATVRSIMTQQPLTCPLDADMAEVQAAMQKRTVARVLVVDDLGRLAGVISLAEIWHHETPLWAGSLSRHITERELRVAPTGGHFDTGRSREA